MKGLFSHIYPSSVFYGVDAFSNYCTCEILNKSLIVYDPNIEHPVIDQISRERKFNYIKSFSQPTLDNASYLADVFSELHFTSIIAIGGGTTIDLVKLGAALSSNSSDLSRIKRLSSRAGALPLAVRDNKYEIIAVPTTVGTGSEVTSTASIKVNSKQRLLCMSPALAPKLAIIDSEMTRSLPQVLLRQGIFEVLVRILGSDCGAESWLPISSEESIFLSSSIFKFLDRSAEYKLDEVERLCVSILSAETHLGWSMQGRKLAPSPLWIIADEISSYLGITKIQATTKIFPFWIMRVLSNDIVWGDKNRLKRHEIMIGNRMNTVSSICEQLKIWGVEPSVTFSLSNSEIESVAQKIYFRWGGGMPLLGKLTVDDIKSLLTDVFL